MVEIVSPVDIVSPDGIPDDFHLLGPDRVLACHWHNNTSVVETYSLFNGELVLLHRLHSPPFYIDRMVVVVSSDGDLAAMYNLTGRGNPGYPCIWNPATSISEARPLVNIDRRDSLSISSNGRYIYALAARRNSCRIVDLHNTRVHAGNIASGDTERSIMISVSADSSTVAVAEVVCGQVVAITAYRVSDGFETFRLTPCRCLSSFKSFTLGADGKLLLLCYGRQIELWNRDNCIGTFYEWQSPQKYLEGATLSEDATYVVGYRGTSRSRNSIVVWSVGRCWGGPLAIIEAVWPASEQMACDIRSVHIDETLDIYLVCSEDGEWHNPAFVLQHRVWSAKLIEAQLPRAPWIRNEAQLPRAPRIPNERFTLHRDGWVTRFDDGSGTLEKLCWIPPSRRIDKNVRFQGCVLPLLSDSGEVSFLDLSAFEQNEM